MQNENFDICFTYTNFSIKWIIGLNIKGKTMKHLWEHIMGNLCNNGFDDRFLDKHQKYNS